MMGIIKRGRRGAHRAYTHKGAQKGAHREDYDAHKNAAYDKIELKIEMPSKAAYAILAAIVLVLGFTALRNYVEMPVGKAYQIVFNEDTFTESVEIELLANVPEKFMFLLNGPVKSARLRVSGTAENINIAIDDRIVFTSVGRLGGEVFDFSEDAGKQCDAYPCEVPFYIFSSSDGNVLLRDIDIEAEDITQEEKEKPEGGEKPEADSESQALLPVIVLKYFPLQPGTQNLDPLITGMSDSLDSIRAKVDSLTQKGIENLTAGTKYHGYKNSAEPYIVYSVYESREFLKPEPTSAIFKSGGRPRGDFLKILTEDVDICDYVDNKGVKQVWIWGYDTDNIAPVESNMAMGTASQAYWNYGSYGDVSNSERTNDMPVCSKTYTLYNYNYQRGLGELLENHGHQIEHVLNWVDGRIESYEYGHASQDWSKLLFWGNFVGSDKPHKIVKPGCGWIHIPPNGKSDYDWGNTVPVLSDCEDWKPDGTGEKKEISCSAWSCEPESGAYFKVWWMQNIPGKGSNLVYEGRLLRNWWEFYADFDEAIKKGKSLVSEEEPADATPPEITITNPINESTISTDSLWLEATTDEPAYCEPYILYKYPTDDKTSPEISNAKPAGKLLAGNINPLSYSWSFKQTCSNPDQGCPSDGGSGGGGSSPSNPIEYVTEHKWEYNNLENKYTYAINAECKDESGNKNEKLTVFYVDFEEKEVESWEVKAPENTLEISENLKIGFNRESIANLVLESEKGYISREELSGILASGKASNAEGSFNYKQKMYFEDADTGYVLVAENNNDAISDFLYFKSGKQIARYELGFEEPFKSNIYDSGGSLSETGDSLSGFEDVEIAMLGKGYTIAKATRNGGKNGQITLIMMAGAVKDTLQEGDSKTYTLNGREYDVRLDYVDKDTVEFNVNGEETGALQEGSIKKLYDGILIGVSGILYQDYAGGAHSATFFLGAEKLELKDTNVKDISSSDSLKADDKAISNSKVIIEGTDDNIFFKVSKISIDMIADDDFYIPSGGKLSESPDLDEPRLLFTNSWDIEYDGVKGQPTEEIIIETNTDKKYSLKFQDGNNYNSVLPLIEAVEPSKIVLGEKNNALVIQENKKIAKDNYLIISDEQKEDGRRKSFALQYKGADKLSADIPKIMFRDLGSGEIIERPIGVGKSVIVLVDGTEFTVSELAKVGYSGITFSVYNISSTSSNDFNVLVDLNANGNIENNIVGLNTYSGASIGIVNEGDIVRLSLGTPHRDDYDTLKPSPFIFELSADSNGNAQIEKSEEMLHKFFMPEEGELIELAYNSHGTLSILSVPEDTPESLLFEYPEKQILPRVFITAKEAEATEPKPGTECKTGLDCPAFQRCENKVCVSFCSNKELPAEEKGSTKAGKGNEKGSEAKASEGGYGYRSVVSKLNAMGYEVTGKADIPGYNIKKSDDKLVFSTDSDIRVFDRASDSFILSDSKGNQMTIKKRKETQAAQKPTHIIEFKEKPLVAAKSEAEKELGIKGAEEKAIPKNIREKIEDRLKKHEQRLEKAKEGAIKEMLRVNPGIESRISSTYKKTFNGVAASISEEEALEIKSLPSVKNVYRNEEVHFALEESVNQIDADEAWEQHDKSDAAITGKGITIGIIDTGVDYTHPDLGESKIEEDRNFEKITESPLDIPKPFLSNDGVVALNKGRVAYPLRNKIRIYSFEDKTTKDISLAEVNLMPVRIALDDDILAYFADDSDKYRLYYHNLKTGTSSKKLVSTSDIALLAVSGNKLVYGRDNSIYVYDIAKSEEKLVDDRFGMPVVSGNQIAYPLPGNYCYDKAVIYDIETEQKKEITPPDVGAILDFKGGKILYVACSKTEYDPTLKTYYIYDINTGEYKKLSQEETKDKDAASKGWRFSSSWINKGSIEDDAIFFSKDVDAKKIIAYDTALDKYFEINRGKISYDFDAEGNKVCFAAADSKIYCHDYSPENDYSIPETKFNSKVIGGYDFVNKDPDPMDDQGHGTHVAATAAGNGILKGVAPDANIVAYKVLDSSGSGYENDIISAIERSVDPNQDGDFSDHLDVISMSLGGGGNPDDPMSKAIDNAVDAGVVAVIAAGNDGPYPETIGSPGTARKAVTIGAVDKCDLLAEFSSRGPVNWDNKTLLKPDVLAPGVSICAAQSSQDTIWEEVLNYYGTDIHCKDDRHIAISGTSMATPHVSGAAALLLQAHPEWSPIEVRSALMSTSLDIGLTPKEQGAGRINALAAMNAKVTVAPQSISFTFKLGEQSHKETITVKNLDDKPITIVPKVAELQNDKGDIFDFASLNVSELTINANSQEDLGFIVSLPKDAGGFFDGVIAISYGAESYRVPFIFDKLSMITLKATVKDVKLYPDFALHAKDFERFKGAGNGWDFEGDSFTFRVPNGQYTAYAVGDFESGYDYIMTKMVEVPFDSEIAYEFKIEDARPFKVKAESLQGTPLKLYDWVKGFNVYNDDNLLSASYYGSAVGNRIIYLSNKPDNGLDMDILVYFNGIPAREEDLNEK